MSFCVVKVTKKCNHKCKFCFLQDLNYPQEISTEEILKNIPDVDTIYITGGEPFFRKDLSYILQKIKEKNEKVKIRMQTNGTSHIFKNHKEIHDFVDSYMFSIHTLNRESFKILMENNDENAIDKLIENIYFCHEQKKEITTNTCVPVNGNHLIETLEEITNMPFTHSNLSFVIGYENNRISYKEYYQNWQEIDFTKIVNLFESKNKDYSFEGFPKCILPKNAKAVDSFTEHFSFDTFFEKKLIYKSKKVFCGSEKKIYIDQCKECSIFKNGKCGGFEEDYFNVFGLENIEELVKRGKNIYF